jgi:hypothetical protein
MKTFILISIFSMIFYYLGKKEGIKEEKERHGIEAWLESIGIEKVK